MLSSASGNLTCTLPERGLIPGGRSLGEGGVRNQRGPVWAGQGLTKATRPCGLGARGRRPRAPRCFAPRVSGRRNLATPTEPPRPQTRSGMLRACRVRQISHLRRKAPQGRVRSPRGRDSGPGGPVDSERTRGEAQASSQGGWRSGGLRLPPDDGAVALR